MKTNYICIEGRVQGVGFRYFALQKAIKYNIKGTVENDLMKKNVEIYCQGEQEDIEQFISELKEGPALCVILRFNVEIRELDPYKDFKVV